MNYQTRIDIDKNSLIDAIWDRYTEDEIRQIAEHGAFGPGENPYPVYNAFYEQYAGAINSVLTELQWEGTKEGMWFADAILKYGAAPLRVYNTKDVLFLITNMVLTYLAKEIVDGMQEISDDGP